MFRMYLCEPIFYLICPLSGINNIGEHITKFLKHALHILVKLYILIRQLNVYLKYV